MREEISMKKIFAAVLLAILALLWVSACAEVSDAKVTAGASFKEFSAAYGEFKKAWNAAWHDVEIDPDDAIPMDTVGFFEDGFYSPLEYLGTGGKIPAAVKSSRGWKSVTYRENGGAFRISCGNPASEEEIYEGTYDADSDILLCFYHDSFSGIRFEYARTDWGYVAQFYDPERGCAHRLTLKGSIGVVGWGDVSGYEPLTGRETTAYPKDLMTYYEVTESGFNFKPRQGPVRKYK